MGFPYSTDIQAVGGAARLQRVLRHLGADDTESSCCQSLNFISAVLLMEFNDERITVATIRQLLKKLGVQGWYTQGMLQLRADTQVLEELICKRLPVVYEVFQAFSFDVVFISSKW